MEENDKTMYLYGASLQGIQNFIFQTDKLKEIIGASALIEDICTTKFQEFEDSSENSIVRAAGNIKHLFKSKQSCENAVLKFPRLVSNYAPGITLCQAVVMINNEIEISSALSILEEKLLVQRNKPKMPASLGFISTKRYQITGLPLVTSNGKLTDLSTSKKLTVNNKEELFFKAFGNRNIKDKFPYELSQIGTDNSWIAVIHADGNGLGKIILDIAKSKMPTDLLKKFSIGLNKATTQASQEAFDKILPLFKDENVYPIRPVVLGGDDLTVICRADLAILFTKYFLYYFEINTKKELLDLSNGLTACAGIAFIKKSFPFHYGYDLAEELCKEAKNVSQRKSSCIMFHKVQDSYITSYKEIKKRELTANGIQLNFGPFYLNDKNIPDDYWSIDQLIEYTNELESISLSNNKKGKGVKSHLRNILTEMFKDREIAHQKMARLNSNSIGIVSAKLREIFERYSFTNSTKRVPFYDMLTIISVKTKFSI